MLSQVLRSLGFAAASAAFATSAGPAWAERPAPPPPPEPTNLVCTYSRGSYSCNSAWGSGNGFPQVVHFLPPDGQQAHAVSERVRAWEAYCRPALRYDRYGVGRYVYRVEGCEFGRAED